MGFLRSGDRRQTMGYISLGDREQFTPAAATGRSFTALAKSSTEKPVYVLPVSLNVIHAKIGREVFSCTAFTAAVNSSMALIVAMAARSAPYLSPSFASSAKPAYALSYVRLP